MNETQTETSPEAEKNGRAIIATLFGAFLTYFSAVDRFGAGGAALILCVLFLAVGIALKFAPKWATSWNWLVAHLNRPGWLIALGILFLVLGLVGTTFDYVSIRLLRQHLPLLQSRLGIANVAILKERFPTEITGVQKHGTELSYRELNSSALFQWAGRFGELTSSEAIYYIESEPIPENCDDVSLVCEIGPMHAQRVVALLVHANRQESLWIKPNIRQQECSISADKKQINIHLELPNEGERIVLLLQATSFDDQSPSQKTPPAEPHVLFPKEHYEFR